jgi:hypothetical protein
MMKISAIWLLGILVLLSACVYSPKNSNAKFGFIPYPPMFMFGTGPTSTS